MSSTPTHHSDDDETRPLTEDPGDARSQERAADDVVDVDEETKRLSKEEAAQHDNIEDAQRAAAEDGEGYGY